MSKRSVIVMPDTEKILETMGEQIKMARLRRNLSTELVAERAGISRTTLWAVEKGTPTVAIGTYAAVLHALGGMDKDLSLVAQDDEFGRRIQDMNLVTPKRAKRKQVASFEYDEEWLKDLTNNVSLDPDLGMFKGRQYTPTDKLMFGVFEDSCPDRWGRLLLKRREAIIAKKEERKPRTLTEVDYLIGVYDETRMGGLRFSTSKGGAFLSDDKELATPPWTTLRKLESASLAFEKNDDGM